MTLREALVGAARPAAGKPFPLQLCCGFEPLHLPAFLKAHLSAELRGVTAEESRPVHVTTGLFGDLAGNVARALAGEPAEPMVVVLEWPDLDPRLGLRESRRLLPGDPDSIIEGVRGVLSTYADSLIAGAATRRIVLTLPSTPLPPWFGALPRQASRFSLTLQALISAFAAQCAAAGVRIAAPITAGEAYDVRSHLNSGFPYSTSYTDALALSITALLHPAAPAKGLVTDLDDTLWAGIVGDAGPANVEWSLDSHTRIHGIYQQFLAGLAEQGVLLGVASKNDPDPVAEAMRRPDFLVSPDSFFPIETNWQSKSDSLRRIAQVWNIGLDSIVFVDDNPLELAEMNEQLPEVECHLFPNSDPSAALVLIQTLQRRFAREHVTEEDRLRSGSIRSGAQLRQVQQTNSDPEGLLAGLEAKIHVSFGREPFDPRALSLINKTNQFNLNGMRWEEADFREFLARPNVLLAIIDYEDRFSQLGKIAVALAEIHGSCLSVKSWVLSCRAFSRRIEFSTLNALFEHSQCGSVELEWQSTPRNTPTRDFLKTIIGEVPESGPLVVTRRQFLTACPPLYAAVSLNHL